MPAAGIVIPHSELYRIQSSVNVGPDSLRNFSDAVMRSKSQKRVSAWSNTVEAQRNAQLKEREDRVDAQEAQRRQVDIAEAVIQLEHRRKAIEKANEILTLESDRLKTFNSAMMLSDVLAERDNQIRIKEQLQHLEHQRELKFEELVKHNCRRMKDREVAELAEKVDKRHQVARTLEEQVQAAKAKRIAEINESEAEGLRVKQRNAEFLQQELDRKQQDRDEAVRAQKELVGAQEYLNQVKQRESDLIKREEAKIEEFARRKDEMMAKRRDREEFVFLEKQKSRQNLIEVQAAKLAQLRDTEEERVAQQCRDAEAEQNKLMAERNQRMREWKLEIERSREAQVKRKDKDKSDRIANERKAAEFCRLIFKKLERDEADEAAEKREASVKLAKDLLTQMDIKEGKLAHERKAEVATVERARRGIFKDISEFQSFAENTIREYAESGKNVVPLLQALKNFHRKKDE